MAYSEDADDRDFSPDLWGKVRVIVITPDGNDNTGRQLRRRTLIAAGNKLLPVKSWYMGMSKNERGPELTITIDPEDFTFENADSINDIKGIDAYVEDNDDK